MTAIYVWKPSQFYSSPNFLIGPGLGIILALVYENNNQTL